LLTLYTAAFILKNILYLNTEIETEGRF